MAQPHGFRDVHAVRHGQQATGSGNALLSDNHSSIVQRTVLEEDVLDEQLVDVGIDRLARFDDFAQLVALLNHDEGSLLAFGHIHAGHDDGHHLGVISCNGFLPRQEEIKYATCTMLRTHIAEKPAYVVLEDDDDC